MGIGLTLVKRLVGLHGGTVTATSAGLGQGSEFVVRLPAGRDSGCRVLRPSRRLERAGRRLRVLVVDDNQDAADSMALLLRLWGYDVTTGQDGAGALEQAWRSYAPDVVLLDIGLPGIDGYEVARRIRAGEANKDIVLVAMTGYGQFEDRQRSAEAGFTTHLVKPVEPEALRRLLADSAGPPR